MTPRNHHPPSKLDSRSAVAERLRELLLLEQRQALSTALTVAQRSQVRAFVGSAQQRLTAARVLRDGGVPSDALAVFWQGIALLARAYLTSLDAEADASDLDPPELLQRLEQQLEQCGRPVSDALRRSLPFAADTAEQSDRLPPGEAALRAEDLDELSRRLAALIETRTPSRLRAQSRLRLALLVTTVMAVPAALWLWSRVPTNLAVNKPVTASSVAESTSPQGIVDERLYGPFGFHSQLEESPWVTIDLQKAYFITDAEVYGRHDCCFDHSVPVTFEVSEDGKVFRNVGAKSDPFDKLEPWNVKKISQVARFVRVRAVGKRPLVLSEVVVHGRAP